MSHRLILEKKISKSPYWEINDAWRKYIHHMAAEGSHTQDIQYDLRTNHNATYQFESSTPNLASHDITVMYFDTKEDMMAWLLEWS